MSTAKILFLSFITFCVLGMFLLFSMQKSAQLSLDMEDMQLISKEKNNKINHVSEALQSAKTKIKKIQTENARIPQLENDIETIENEKLVYVQQLDDFQTELQNQVDIAKQHVSKINTLQEQQNSDQQSLTLLKSQGAELTTALEVALLSLEEKTLRIEKDTDTLSKKDRVIHIYKQKLDKAAEDIVLLETTDSNEQLNLVLILDELAHKTALAKDLGNKLAIANNEAIAAGVDSSTIITVNNENQALVDKLSLENDYLTTGIKELNKTIKELETKKAAAEELVASFTAEVEQLQFLVADKDKAFAALALEAEAYALQINQLSVTISSREEEVIAVKEQAQGIAAPLTEKITGLELQVTQAASQFAGLTDELSQSQSGLSSMEEEKQLINDELESAKVALESMQSKLGETENIQKALQESISTLEQEVASKDESLETLTVSLTAAAALATDNETFAAGLNEQLTASQNAVISQKIEQEAHIAKLTDEVAEAKAAATELMAQTAGLQARNEELLAALVSREEQTEVNDAIEPEDTPLPVTDEQAVIEEAPAIVTDTVVVSETEAVEIIVIDEATEVILEAEVEAATEPVEVIAIEEVAPVEELEATDGSVVVEEATDVTEIVTDDVQAQTEQAGEEVPLQDDSANVENL